MITLSSDFGSPYPAAMKGVALQTTAARLVDVAHDFPRQDVRASAFWLREVLPYFPPAVHLVVVDPGVGTDRAALVVRAGSHALVGPDNGVLVPVARKLAPDGAFEAFEIAYEEGTAWEAAVSGSDGGSGESATGTAPDESDREDDGAIDVDSATFHGRDVFAPAAARVHERGIENCEEVSWLAPTEEFVDLTFPEPTIEDDRAVGTVIAIDGFGNVITNVPGSVVAPHFGSHVKANGVWASARRTYADVEPGHRVVTVGSHGYVELAVNQGRGDDTFGIDQGGRVRLSW